MQTKDTSISRILIFTDGSSRGNPGPGGYGIIMHLEHSSYRKEFSDGYRYTTNNRMELLAVIVALEKIKNPNQSVVVTTDSRYIVNAVEKKWLFNWVRTQFKGKKNKDLWMRFLQVYKLHNIQFRWIKGHNNHPDNERCDFLAVQASKKQGLKKDAIFEAEDGVIFNQL